jgi:hypothetical protein
VAFTEPHEIRPAPDALPGSRAVSPTVIFCCITPPCPPPAVPCLTFMALFDNNPAPVSGPDGSFTARDSDGFHGGSGSLRGTIGLKGMVVLVGLVSAVPAWAGDFFADKIEPLLKSRCYECHAHSSGKMKGGLTLDARSGWEQGGDTGPSLAACRT